MLADVLYNVRSGLDDDSAHGAPVYAEDANASRHLATLRAFATRDPRTLTPDEKANLGAAVLAMYDRLGELGAG